MAIRSGSEYRAALRDGRRVWFRGEEIKDVTAHPAFRRKVEAISMLFDAGECLGAAAGVFCPEADSICRPSFLVPRTREDLRTRRGWSELLASMTFGLMGRSPDFLQTAISAFASAAEYFGSNDHQFVEHIKGLYRSAAVGDLFLARATVGPAINRGKPYSQQRDAFSNLRVLRELDGGVVLRGTKMISTNVAIADELLVFPLSGFFEGDEEYALAFMIPVATAGLKIVCRDAYDDGSRSDFDFPLSSRFEESDSLCVFDDVIVPWERMFIYRNVALANSMYVETCSRNLTGYQTLIRISSKVELLVAIAICCAELNGCSRHLHVQEMLGEAISYREVVKGLLLSSESGAVINKWGVFCPDARPAQSARILFHKFSGRLIEIIQTVAGGTLLAVPTLMDFESEIGPLIERAFGTESDGWSPRNRVNLLKMAWELTGDAFGQRQQIYEKYHAGDPVRIAAALYSHSNRAPFHDLARVALNGIAEEVTPLELGEYQRHLGDLPISRLAIQK